MNEWSERDREEFVVIDEALRTYPLAPAPIALAPMVMERITKLTPAPRFRLLWIDYALGLFGVSVFALVVLLWQGLLPGGLSDPAALTALSFDPGSTIWLLSLLGGLVVLSCCLAVTAVLLIQRPAYHVRFTSPRRGSF